MTATSSFIALTTDVADLHGVGPKRAAAFRKLGIRCVADLLLHLPSRYEKQFGEQSIAGASKLVGPAHGSAANLTVEGEVATIRPSGQGRRARYEATLMDSTGTILLTWFNAPWMKGKLHPGMRIRATGKAKRWGDYLQLTNAQWRDLNDEKTRPPLSDRPLIPLYPAGDTLHSGDFAKVIDIMLDDALSRLEDHLDPDYRRSRELPSLAEAYRMVHRPASEAEVVEGRRRLAFDELLLLQLAVMMKRRHRRVDLKAVSLRHDPAVKKRIMSRIPFRLTRGQKTVIADVVEDLAKEIPMNRLLQGDVGSGKTVVAVYAMLLAIAHGHQAAFMTPTELLAEQHALTVRELLADSKVRVELLTGSLKQAARRKILSMVEAGDVDILIGTHALLTETVSFKSLAVAVIDEQHRFGVHQRAGLRTKLSDSTTVPHTLVMTATPIPRTLSLSVFGDLDISTIRGNPPGRQPIITRLVSPAQSSQVYEYLRSRLECGEQGYIVVPAVDSSEEGLKNITDHVRSLREGPLRDFSVEAVHGRLEHTAREAIMNRFRAGEIHCLVATTVIEVGVDVPNACLMIIEQADRFGLAQLHQLRGRVGRGSARALCTLIADTQTEDARARLDTIVSTTDGFAIAEKDLELRGPGELFGARQSGLAPFRVAELPRDMELLQMARRDADAWIENNPELAGERDALLRKRLFKAHGRSLGLGDVA